MATETLSTEAARMCRMCSNKDSSNMECNLSNRTTTTQNILAKKGECTAANILGPIIGCSEQFAKVRGRMRKLENNDWIFESGYWKEISTSSIEGKSDINQTWQEFPIEGTPYTLLWKNGKSGRLPKMPPLRLYFIEQGKPPVLTISFENDKSYLDINPGIHCVIDASGNEFIDGGGDCVLIEEKVPEPLLQLSNIAKQDKS